jgi:hypothetical protein
VNDERGAAQHRADEVAAHFLNLFVGEHADHDHVGAVGDAG